MSIVTYILRTSNIEKADLNIKSYTIKEKKD